MFFIQCVLQVTEEKSFTVAVPKRECSDMAALMGIEPANLKAELTVEMSENSIGLPLGAKYVSRTTFHIAANGCSMKVGKCLETGLCCACLTCAAHYAYS